MKLCKAERDYMSVASLVLGIVGCVLSFVLVVNNIVPIFAVVGFVLGIVAIKKGIGNRGAAIAGIVLCVASVIVTLAVQAYVGAVLDAASESLDRTTGKQTEQVLQNDVNVTFEDYVIEEKDYYQEGYLPVVVTNISNKVQSYSITVDAIGKDGNRIKQSYVYVNDLGPGKTVVDDRNFMGFTQEECDVFKDATFEVVKVGVTDVTK